MNAEDATLTIPGHSCLIKSEIKTSLSLSWLYDMCEDFQNKKIMKINVDFNGIQMNLFEKLPNFEILVATGLNFSNIFLSSANLKKIHLSRNKITTFRLLIYKSLLSLDLSYNELENINFNPAELDELKLEFLNLSHNNLRSIDGISNLPNLKYLDLSRNKIEKLEENHFSTFRKLTSLNLSFNKLSVISGCIFCAQKNLKSIDFFNNNIRTIDGLMIHPSKSLKYLDMRENELIDFDYKTLVKNNTKLKEIAWSNKNLYCSFLTIKKKTTASCFKIVDSNKICCLYDTTSRTKRSISNPHFHAIINNKKLSHNVSAIQSQEHATETNTENSSITLKDFFGKLHHLNVENVRTFLNVTLDKIDSSVSQLDKKYNKILNKIDSDMFLVNKKLDEFNETLSDIVLEISNLTADENDVNVTQNPKKTFIENDYDDMIRLLRLCFFFILVLVILSTLIIMLRIRRSYGIKEYRMNLLNMESVDHH